jgi:membrane-associated phospholipid phosphatase
MSARPSSLGQQRCESLHPAIDGDVIDLDATFGEQFLDVAVGEAEAQVPADRQDDDVGREAEAGEVRPWSRSRARTARSHAASLAAPQRSQRTQQRLSETITVTVLAVLTVAITALVWRRWREPMLVAVAVAGEVAIFLATTLLVDRRRPPVSHLDQAPPTSSFPSGHTAAAICLYGALAVLASERARSALVRGLTLTLAVLIPLAVATARIYRGMQYLTDVVGGIVLGSAWLLATIYRIRLGVAHWQLRHRTASRT